MAVTKRYRDVLIILLAVGIVFVALGTWFPIGPDYLHHYRAKPIEIFNGEASLYDGTGTTFGLPPWAVPLLGATALLPIRYGQAILTIATIAGLILASVSVLRPTDRIRKTWLFFAIINLHVFDLIIRGNVDGLTVLGMGIAWIAYKRERPLLLGVGFWLMSIKPLHVVLMGLLLLWGMRRWHWRRWLLVAAPLGISVIVTTMVMGPTWLPLFVRYNVADKSPYPYLQTSLWRLTDYLGFPSETATIVTGIAFVVGLVFIVTRNIVNREALAVVLGINTVFAPYALGAHYVVLAPALVVLIVHNRAYALLWLLTLTPLMRIHWGFNYVWLDSMYTMAILVGAVYVYVTRYSRHQQMSISPSPEAQYAG